MKKKILIATILLMTLGIIAVKFLLPNRVIYRFGNWGRVLKTYTTNENNDEIYMIGKNTSITKLEIELSEKFYQLSGSNATQAKKQAEQFIKQENALYAKALKAGYTVTDKEVYEYLDTLKQTLSEAENSEYVKAIVKSYGSEEEYWDYLFKVYQKDLPIQKYVSSLENDYAKQLGMDKTSEEFQEYWDTKFESIKNDLVEKENYNLVVKN